MNLVSFKEALQNSDEDPTLLLGNGFSVSWNQDIFSYRSLKEKSTGFEHIITEAFARLGTVDFEEVIRAFEHAAVICGCAEIDNQFQNKADSIRNILIDTIASNHPDFPSKILASEFEPCVEFLSNFKRIYTLNYDMLLYWVLIRDLFRENEEKPKLKKFSDGFAYNGEDFLNWDGSSFEVHYLHGALHLFEESELLKLNYRKTTEPLKSQFVKLIREQKKFPLFVAEGSSEKKLRRIRSSGYLTRCLNSLQKIGSKKTSSSVFTYGVSFSENDQHILDALAKNNCQKFFIGIYGSLSDQRNKVTVKRVERLKALRDSKSGAAPLVITYFDSATASVWR